MKTLFTVTGMNCSACSAHVENSVKKLNGVFSVSVNLLGGNMIVDYNPEILNSDMIINAVAKAGYGASLASAVKGEKSTEYKTLLKRLIVSSVLLIVLVYIGMGHMIGLPMPSFAQISVSPSGFAIVLMLLSATIIAINFKYYISGFSKLVRLNHNMDSLVAMGSCISFVYSLVLTVKIIELTSNSDITTACELAHRLYYESAAMILVFISVGKTLETKSKVRTRSAVDSLINMKPATAVRQTDKGEETIAAAAIETGDVLIVRSGEQIPSDGVIIEGHASVDESFLTGESIPSEKNPGDEVYQATISKNGYFKFKVTQNDSETALSKIIALVEEASSTKAPISRLADRISAVFVPIVFGLALLTFVVWLIIGAPYYEALQYAITVIVISCPCSLGLATPAAITCGTGIAAKMGILIKSAAVLEEIHKIDTVVFDKTGTITNGSLRCIDILPSQNITKQDLLNLVYTAENMSEHPIAKAITEYAKDFTVNTNYKAENYRLIPGGGIYADIDGKAFYGGNYSTVSKYCNIDKNAVDSAASEGKTPILFCYENKYLGMITLADTVRIDSEQAVNELKKLSVTSVMLTGDNRITAENIAKQVGISECFAELKPIDKQKFIEKQKADGHHVAMVGDGINDAPALTLADIGIAVGAGADIAIESADIVLTGSNPIAIVNIISLGRRVIRTIKQNLFWAFFYNCLGIPIAAGVFARSFGIVLNPMIAAALMSCSSLFVVSNALRLNLFKPIEMKEKTSDNVLESKISQETDIKEKNTMKVQVIVNGMMCVHCKAHVEEAFNNVDGISCTVDLDSKTAFLDMSHDMSDEELKNIVIKAGYEPVQVIRQ